MVLINGVIKDVKSWSEIKVGDKIKVKSEQELRDVLDDANKCKECRLYVPIEPVSSKEFQVTEIMKTSKTVSVNAGWAICKHMVEEVI